MNDRQTLFVIEYLKDFNATRAALAAGYSPKTAYSIGQENLKKPEIREAIDQHIMSAEEAAANLTEIARGDIADLMALSSGNFNFELTIIDPVTGERKPNPKTKLIKTIEQTVTTIIPKDGDEKEIVKTRIELYSRHEASRDILKFRGKMVDRTETLNIDLNTLTDEQLEKLKDGEPLTNVLKHSAT